MPEAAAEVVNDQPATPQAPEWVASIKDDALKGALAKFETPEKFLKETGLKLNNGETDWRKQIKDADARKFAEESPDLDHFAKRGTELRKQVSKAIFRPGKDATEQQQAAYRKALGIPEAPEGYEFPAAGDVTEDAKAARAKWAKTFHEQGVSKEGAKALITMLGRESAEVERQQQEADKAFATAQETALKTDWGADYDKNKTLANRAFREIANRAGVKVDELTKIETKDGRFLLDRADIVRVFAVLGREMAEGTLGPVLTDGERETLDEEIRAKRKQISEAQAAGDSKRANRLFLEEQALLGKQTGDQPIVGSRGRMV